MAEKLYYIGLYNHQPMRHTLSENYVETNQASQNYIKGNHLNDYTVMTLNQASLDELLKKYDLEELKVGLQYTATYWQTLRERRLQERQNKIEDAQREYLSQQPPLSWSLVNAMKLFFSGIKNHDRAMMNLLICVLLGVWFNLVMIIEVSGIWVNPHVKLFSGTPIQTDDKYYGLLLLLMIFSLSVFSFIYGVRSIIQDHQNDKLRAIRKQH